MFARFDENPAMTLQDIKETKRYGRTHAQTHEHTYGRTTWKQYTHHKQSLLGVLLTHHDETKKRAHDSQIVRDKENLKLNHGGSSYR